MQLRHQLLRLRKGVQAETAIYFVVLVGAVRVVVLTTSLSDVFADVAVVLT